MSSHRLGARRRLEGTLPGEAAGDPRSHDLPDFRTLGDGPYPPILLEAMERAGALFVAEMLVAHLESVPAGPDALVFTAGDAHRCAIRPSGTVSGSLLSERPAVGNSSSA